MNALKEELWRLTVIITLSAVVVLFAGGVVVGGQGFEWLRSEWRQDISNHHAEEMHDDAKQEFINVRAQLKEQIDIGRPSRVFPVTPPGVRVRTRRFDQVKQSRRRPHEGGRASRTQRCAGLAERPGGSTFARVQLEIRQPRLRRTWKVPDDATV